METVMARKAFLALAAATTLLGVAACASPEELRRRDEAACASYGFQPGTPDFSACLQREALARSYGETPGVSLGFGFGAFHSF
jgi:hypothetical protein